MTIDIDSAYALSAEQIAAFERDGYIKLKNVLSPEATDPRVITLRQP